MRPVFFNIKFYKYERENNQSQTEANIRDWAGT